MKISRVFLITLLTLLPAVCLQAKITGSWKLHPTFDNSVVRVIDTPEKCFFMGYNQSMNSAISFKNVPDMSLFYYDKEGDEIVAAAQRHDMASTAVRMAEYNGEKGYLLVVYDDSNIDFLYDSGEVRNFGALKNASIPGLKTVNFISFDPDHDMAWLATEFGYVCINDKKMEVAESRNYSVGLSAIMRLGNDLYLSTETATYKAPLADPRFNLSEYSRPSDIQGAAGLYPLSNSRFLRFAYSDSDNQSSIQDLTAGTDGQYTVNRTVSSYSRASVAPAKDGFIIMAWTSIIYFDKTKSYADYINRNNDISRSVVSAAWTPDEVFAALPRKGLCSYKLNSEDKTYSLSRDFMLPNAPNAYISRSMAYHNRYGMLVNSHGNDYIFFSNQINEPILLSALKDGLWTPLSAAYRNPAQTSVGYNPFGVTIDPDNDKYVYMGSPFSGMTRLNLDDPDDILHFTHPADAAASLPGYVKVVDTNPEWARICYFSQPLFDANNILWTYYDNYGDELGVEFRYLMPEDRKATTTPENAREWKSLYVKGFRSGMPALFLPLKHSSNKNLLLLATAQGLFVYDHNGTPDNKSDDKSHAITTFTDQDGGVIDSSQYIMLEEDAETGVVWVGTNSGFYYCQPRNILQGQAVLNKVKIARNDGTSLADYLLDGVGVSDITSDASGRKWIASVGAGIVVTTSDCKTILEQFTTDNSDIPSNNIYQLEYNPSSRSIMASTDHGLTEFFIGGENASASDEETVRAYPNPVAPDYYGWVTIDGLPDNSLVKIVDSNGSLVRELGRAEAGSIQWDVNNLYGSRVRTGVYYILSSPTDGSGQSNVAKILVMN